MLGKKLAGPGERWGALTCLWGLLAHMLSFHGPNASTKHDGLDPLTPLAVRELKAQGAGKAWNMDVNRERAQGLVIQAPQRLLGHTPHPASGTNIHVKDNSPLHPPASPASTGSPNLLP